MKHKLLLLSFAIAAFYCSFGQLYLGANYTRSMYKGDVKKSVSGTQYRVGFLISEVGEVYAAYSRGGAIKSPSSMEYYSNTGSGVVASEASSRFSSVDIMANIHVLRLADNKFSLYIPAGSSVVWTNYDEKPTGSVPANSTLRKNDVSNVLDVTFNIGAGVNYWLLWRIGLFAESYAAIPTFKTTRDDYDDIFLKAPFSIKLNGGLRVLLWKS
jgi:hypothetical protein